MSQPATIKVPGWALAAWARLRRVFTAPWAGNHRLGLALIVVSAITSVTVAFAGPSPVTLNLGERVNLLPPWYLPAGWVTLNEWVAVVALWLGISLGALGLLICWRAVNLGWRPNNRKLFGLGAGLSVITCLVPPMTSADVLMYAAYGRLQNLGMNPYDITPAEIFRQEFDSLLVWTERPWQDTPSVYGPVASASQALAAWLGDGNMHNTVFWLQVLALVPFLLIGALMFAMARSDARAQTRAVLFTVLNPLMIWSVLAGAHNEALTLVFAIVGLFFIRRSPFLAGVGIGLAGTVKVSLVFYGLAMCWGYRHDWRKLLQLCVGAAIPLVLAYGFWAPQALLAAYRNAGYMSAGSWAPWLQGALAWVIGDFASRIVIGLLGWVLLVWFARMLSQVLPWRLAPGAEFGTDPQRDPLTITVRTTVVLTTAWLVTSPYTLSWYDLITWVPLGLMVATRLDLLLIWRGLWLSLAYVTGRAVEFSPGMQAASGVLRDVFSTGAQWVVLIAIVIWWRQEGGRWPWPFRRRPQPAAVP